MEKVKDIFNKYKMIVLMNVIVFIVLFFGLGLFIVPHFKAIVWRILFVLLTILVTDIFYILKKIKYEQVLLSLPIIFILNLIFLKFCTLRDLYGITSYEINDKCPAIIDALLIDMIIVFIEYVTLLITRFIINIARKDIKEEKKKTTKKKNNNKKGKKNID